MGGYIHSRYWGNIMVTPTVQNLDHLGLVAGIIDQIGLVKLVNEHVGEDPHQIVSTGVVLKAMLLNGLGMVSAPLYLFSQFFEGKATEHLLGAGVKPEYLNDDRLGRALDTLWKKGLSSLFMKISFSAVRLYGIEVKAVHLDSTSFAVEGAYETSLLGSLPEDGGLSEKTDALCVDGKRTIQIRRGYSRDHRPELKQFMMNLISSNDSGIPLFLSMADGNQVDSEVFGPLMGQFSRQWTFDGIHVADAALYTLDNLQHMQGMQWVSRVPLSIKAASQLLDEIDPASFVPSDREGYSVSMVGNQYAQVNQHWVVVRSQQRTQSDLRAIERKVEKAQRQAQSALKKLQAQSFDCPLLAQAAAEQCNQTLKYHQLINVSMLDVPHYATKGRPAKGAQPIKLTHQITATLEKNTAAIERLERRAGLFILATPAYDEQTGERTNLSANEILGYYKDQSLAEKGFRFLKDPMFFTDSVFLKSPKRIEALGCVMALCLLVYSLGERFVRTALRITQQTIPNQLGKPTERPTLRWLFQCFQAVHLVVIDGVKQVVNLTDKRKWILRFFPEPCRSYYYNTT